MSASIESQTIVHNKYPTIGELLNSNDMRIIQASIKKISDPSVKEYVVKWLIKNKSMTGNLTNRIKSISSLCISEYVLSKMFTNFSCKPVNKIAIFTQNETICRIHKINPSMCGTFMDYLVRRIIAEIRQETFQDHRTNASVSLCKQIDSENRLEKNTNPIVYDTVHDRPLWWFRSTDIEHGGIHKYMEPEKNDKYKCGILKFGNVFQCLEKCENYMKIIHNCRVCYVFHFEYLEELTFYSPIHEPTYSISKNLQTGLLCCNYPICKFAAINKAANVHTYKTVDILPDIYINSLSHTEMFLPCSSCMNMQVICQMYEILCDPKFVNEFTQQIILPLTEYLTQFIDGKLVLSNPRLGGNYEYSIPADCDIVVGDILIDIKCTEMKKGNEQYEILQLLGYSALLLQNPDYNIHIQKMCVMNLLEGQITVFNCGEIGREQYVNFLKLLTHKN